MSNETKPKKRVVISYHNLTPELQQELKKKYPHGFSESMMRIDKAPNDFFYAVVFETEEVNYLVKIDVKVDGSVDEDDDKEYYDEEINGADEIIDPVAEDAEED